MMRLLFAVIWILVGNFTFGQSIDTLDLDAITISAAQATVADPITFQNISAQSIDKVYYGQNPTTIIERLSPSIVTYGDGGANLGNYVNFRMRGIHHTRINKTLDGVPLDDMVDQATYFSNFSDFGNSLGGIQVQRGVGTSNNGIASYGGAINFEAPKLFSADRGGEVQLLTGSFNTLRASAEISTGLMDNKLSFYGRMSRTTSDGFKNNSSSDATGFFISGGYFGEKDVIKVTAFSGKSERGQAYLPVLLSDINRDPKTNYNLPNDIDDFEQELVILKYSRLGNNGFNWNTSAYYGGARGVFPFAVSATEQYVYGVENDHLGIISDINYQSNDLALKGGIHLYTFDRSNFEYLAPDSNNPYDSDTTDKNEISAFGKINYQTGKVGLTADIQIRNVSMNFSPTEFRDRNWTFFNPKIGVTYTIDSRHAIYASYGRSGREPTRSDVRNSDDRINEEFVNDFELGLRSGTKHIQLNANLFYMDFENEISLVGALQELSYFDIRTNVPSSYRTGFELQGVYHINDDFDFGINATYMKTNVDNFEGLKDVQQIFSPEWIIGPDLSYSISDKFGLNFSGQYVSESFIELSNRSDYVAPSFFIMNAQVDFQLFKNLEINGTVNNIFDSVYFTDGAPVDIDFDGNPEGPGFRVQPPRNAYFMLRWSF